MLQSDHILFDSHQGLAESVEAFLYLSAECCALLVRTVENLREACVGVLLCCLHEGATVPVTRPREEGFQFQTSHGMNGKTGVPISRTQQKPYDIIIHLCEGIKAQENKTRERERERERHQ